MSTSTLSAFSSSLSLPPAISPNSRCSRIIPLLNYLTCLSMNIIQTFCVCVWYITLSQSTLTCILAYPPSSLYITSSHTLQVEQPFSPLLGSHVILTGSIYHIRVYHFYLSASAISKAYTLQEGRSCSTPLPKHQSWELAFTKYLTNTC